MGTKRGRWFEITVLAVALAGCDGGGEESDAGAPGVDGGSSVVDGGGTSVDAGETADTGVVDPPDGGGSPATPGDCTEVCVDDDDCADQLGCVDDRCACTSDARCQVGDSWTSQGCATNDDCSDSLFRCVEWDSTTYCVVDQSSAFNCAIGSGRKVEVTLADGTGTIETCIDTDLACGDDGACGVPPRACEDDFDCENNSLPRCDVSSGRCVCTAESCTRGTQCDVDGACGCAEDSACPGELRCDVASARCGCVDDGNCSDGEICRGGQCRCTTEAGCGIFISPTNPGTTLECIPL